ncbi:MAG: deoxyribodipyrimidine photo-lyase, partial [Beijerinckiaceae bacterium]|nr:deoxyribodipyrimidine photo-lyase [Beijerinckiaceae bacterium]
MSVSIVWFRNDLRLSDNPALVESLRAGLPVVPVFVLDDETEGLRPIGGASRWWLHHSLHSLDTSLRKLGSRLTLRRGPAERVLPELAAECGAEAIFWNRVYDEGSRNRDAHLKKSLNDHGLRAESFKANLLFEPWEIKNQSGAPFKVFTPFWRACRAHASPGDPLPAPKALPAPKTRPASDALDDWRLLPTKPDWAGGLRTAWKPGENGAKDRLSHFLDEALEHYRQARDLPAVEGT